MANSFYMGLKFTEKTPFIPPTCNEEEYDVKNHRFPNKKFQPKNFKKWNCDFTLFPMAFFQQKCNQWLSVRKALQDNIRKATRKIQREKH